MKRYYFLFSCFLVLSIMFVQSAYCQDPGAKYPSRPIEYVTHVAPGGSMDIIGRVLAKAIEEKKIFDKRLVITYKRGSGGAVSYGYTLEKKGNPHLVLAVTSGSFTGTPVRNKLPYTFRNFTPICNILSDGAVLVVRKDSPFKSVDDIIAEAKKRPKQLNQGGPSFTSNESMMGRFIQKNAGVEWNFISFSGDVEAIMNVLGGNVDFAFCNPYGIVEHVKAGKLRVLLTGAPSRYEAFPDVPTIKEVGLGEPITTLRGFVGPPDMPQYAQKKLEWGLKKAFESERFTKFRKDVIMQPLWVPASEQFALLEKTESTLKVFLEELGMLK